MIAPAQDVGDRSITPDIERVAAFIERGLFTRFTPELFASVR
jgi:hypothetical protein